MTFWTYRDIPYSLRQEANSSDWRWTVDHGEGVYLTGASSTKLAALKRAFQTIDLMPGMPRLETPRRLRSPRPAIDEDGPATGRTVA